MSEELSISDFLEKHGYILVGNRIIKQTPTTEAELFEAFKKINPNDPEVKTFYYNIFALGEELEHEQIKAFKLYLENYKAKQELKKLLGGKSHE